MIPIERRNYMLNQTVLIGRITHEPELKETDNGTKVANITLAVPRGYKNQNGEYDTDFISCSLWRGIAENTVNYVKKGDLIAVKGRLQTHDIELEDETKKRYVEVIAERVTFLSKKVENKEGA